MEYEKGNWLARKSKDSGLWHIETEAGGIYIACCPPVGEANAQLIAAAPRMHKALQLYIEHQEGTRGHYCSVCHNEIEKALAEVEGK